MAIVGVFTTEGISKSIDVASQEGFHIDVKTFSVSRTVTSTNPAVLKTVTAPNAGTWYTGAITSAIKIDTNTIKITATIPQGVGAVVEDVKEIYLNGEFPVATAFVLAVGQPTENIIYDPAGTVVLEMQIRLVDIDLTANYLFSNTIAAELATHETDPNAHAIIQAELKKAGIFVPLSAIPYERRGQSYEQNVEFGGTKSTFTHAGVTFTATFNGTELNGETITFDNVKTVDQLRSEFNAINSPNTVEHDGVGTEVLSAAVGTLLGGTYTVNDKDIVYKDVDGVYKQALADGTIKSRVAGIAYRDDKCITTGNYIDINTGFAIGSPLFLSGTSPGLLTTFDTNVSMGLALGTFILFHGYIGDLSTSVSQDFDAIVTNASGAGQFLTTQEAINFVGPTGRILINKLEDLKATINTLGKNLTMEFNGPDKGWRKFAGLGTQFTITFDSIPTQGTFRMEWDFQESNDLPFNASNVDIQNEFNLFNGHNGFTVTGNFTTGFVFTSDDLDTYPIPTFVFAGTNEIQRFDFSNIPNDGTIRFDFEGQQTINFPWDDLASDLKIALENLSTLQNVNITGEFATQFFQIEYQGGFLQDGVQEQSIMQVVATDLDLSGAATDVNGTTVVPINASIVQKGKKPASNLFDGTTPIVITVTLDQTGEPVGPDRAINVDSTNIRIGGLGKAENFAEGIVLENTATDVIVEMYFPNTTLPITSVDKLAGIDYSFDDVQGFAKDVFSQLKLTEHPTNPKRLKISGAQQLLATGITLTSEISNLVGILDGAEVDFSANPGKVYDKDGIADLGLDFDMPTIAADQWRWFSVNLVPKQSLADQSLEMQVLILPADNDGATKALAEKAPFADKPLGLVAIQGALGDKEKTQITTLKDTFGSLKGKTLTLFNPVESVAFWFSDPSLDTPQVEDTTGVTGVNNDLFNSTTTKVLAGKITLASLISIDKIHLFIKKIGAPTGTVAVQILGENLGEPDLGNVIATGVSLINMTSVPTNFSAPVVVDLGSVVNIPPGNYYVEINGDLYTFSAGNFLAWQTDTAGGVEIFNRDPAGAVWLSALGNRVAGFDLVQTIKGFPALALAAGREVEITNLVDNDLQSVVATKLKDAIDGDAAFSATVSTNKVIAENDVLGDVTDASMGDTGFFETVLVQGTDTDVTGIEDVENENIHQIIAGSGGGGGTGDSVEAIKRFEQYLFSSDFRLGAVNSFKQALPNALVDEINSTGKFSFATKLFEMAIGETMQSIQLLDFGTNKFPTDSDLKELAVRTYWSVKDANAIHSVSRMDSQAGTFQVIDMTDLDDTDVLYGSHVFEDEKTFTDIQSQLVANLAEVDLDDGTTREVNTQEFSFVSDRDVSHINVYMKRIGAIAGKFNLVISQDDGLGDPDLSTTIVQRGFFSAQDIGVAETAVRIDVNQLLALGVTYHIVLETDADYKADYSDGVRELQIVNGTDGALPNYKSYDGVSFTPAGGTATFKYEIFDQALILDTLQENPFANEASILELDDGTTRDRVGQPFVLTGDRNVLVRKTIRLKKLGAALGSTFVGVFRDNGGNPDLSKQMFEKSFANADFVVGDNDEEIILPCIGLNAGTYHWVVRTDQTYKDNFTTGVDAIQVATSDSPFDPGILSARTYNGTVWADTGTKAAVFKMEGRDLKLVFKVESTIASSLSTFGVAYDVLAGEITSKALPLDFFNFNGNEDKQIFNLSFKPDASFTEVHVNVDGQTFRHGDFEIEGNSVVFPAGSFAVPNELFTVQIDNLKKMGNNFIDDNPRIINLLKENNLVGDDLDFGRSGRSTRHRADDGVKVEIQVTADFGLGRGIRIEEY